MYLQAAYCEKCGAPVIRYHYVTNREACTCKQCGNEIVFFDREDFKKSLPYLPQVIENDEYEIITVEDLIDEKIEEYDRLFDLLEEEYEKRVIDEVEISNLNVRYWCLIAFVISLVITVFSSAFISSKEIPFIINSVWMAVFTLFLIANSYLQYGLVKRKLKGDS